MTLNEIAIIGAIILSGMIFFFTHDDEDAYYPEDSEHESI